jgi:dTDP-4-amino-4,6-dideoxygalactose transaminase
MRILSRSLPPDVPREALIKAMKAEDADAHFHYVPLHSMPAGRQYGLANCR